MKAIVVTDQNAGLPGMKLVELSEPSSAAKSSNATRPILSVSK